MFIQYNDPEWTLYWKITNNEKWLEFEEVLESWEATCLGFLPVERDGDYFEGLLWEYENRSYVPIVRAWEMIYVYVDHIIYFGVGELTKSYFDTKGDRIIVLFEELVRGHRITFTDYQKPITL